MFLAAGAAEVRRRDLLGKGTGVLDLLARSQSSLSIIILRLDCDPCLSAPTKEPFNSRYKSVTYLFLTRGQVDELPDRLTSCQTSWPVDWPVDWPVGELTTNSHGVTTEPPSWFLTSRLTQKFEHLIFFEFFLSTILLIKDIGYLLYYSKNSKNSKNNKIQMRIEELLKKLFFVFYSLYKLGGLNLVIFLSFLSKMKMMGGGGGKGLVNSRY